jgi:Domain of unknown function (DUF4105)
MSSDVAVDTSGGVGGARLVGLGCTVLLGWMALAISFDFSLLGPPWLRAGLGVLVPVTAVVALWLVRPRWWVFPGILGAFVVVLAAWLAIPPSNERDWQPDVATLAFADIQGDRVLVHNVRNAEYRTETDYIVRLEDRALDLSELRSLDVFLVHWGSPLIAHTMMRWGFEGDRYLAISIETRKEQGEQYSALLDELAYDIGAIDRSLPFPVLQAKSHVNERAKAANDDPRFSGRIRAGLPRMSLDPRSGG